MLVRHQQQQLHNGALAETQLHEHDRSDDTALCTRRRYTPSELNNYSRGRSEWPARENLIAALSVERARVGAAVGRVPGDLCAGQRRNTPNAPQ